MALRVARAARARGRRVVFAALTVMEQLGGAVNTCHRPTPGLHHHVLVGANLEGRRLWEQIWLVALPYLASSPGLRRRLNFVWGWQIVAAPVLAGRLLRRARLARRLSAEAASAEDAEPAAQAVLTSVRGSPPSP
jgi:hypothetical protein